ncbi:MAG TPA: cytochrome c family protein [Bacteroidota bacterium]|nr:cytochrome c family protein [Bacteroidota bacterium]
MKRFVELALVVVLAGFLAQSSFAEHKYVGVTFCSVCHKTEKQGKQFDIWKASKHASAFATLETPKAEEIAKAKGLKVKASEAPECLECHVTGYGESKELTSALKPQDGVQCESCHGAGSDYKSMPVMKDVAKAEAAGLVIAKDDPKLCTKCHNSKSPTFKEFNYKEAWEKIKHPIAAK